MRQIPAVRDPSVSTAFPGITIEPRERERERRVFAVYLYRGYHMRAGVIRVWFKEDFTGEVEGVEGGGLLCLNVCLRRKGEDFKFKLCLLSIRRIKSLYHCDEV